MPVLFVLQVVTKDLVCTEVSAVCYYRIENMSVCCSSLAGVPAVLQALLQVSVRKVLAHHTFNNVLQNRSEVAHQIQVHIVSLLEPYFQKAKSSTNVKSMFYVISYKKLQGGLENNTIQYILHTILYVFLFLSGTAYAYVSMSHLL